MDIYWRKIKYICAACIIICSLAAAGWYAKTQGTHLLQSVRQVGETEKYWYGIDVTRDKYYLFRISKEDRSQEVFTYPLEKEGSLIRLSDCQMDDKGNMYVSCTVSRESATEQSIDYCNFQTGKLEKRWDIDQICQEENKRYFTNTMADDQEIYLCLVNEENIFWYRLTEDGGREFYRKDIRPGADYGLIVNGSLDAVFMDREVNICKIDKNGKKYMIFTNDGRQITRDNFVYSFDDQKLHLWNVTAQQAYEIRTDMTEENIQVCRENLTLEDKAHIENLEDGRQVLAVKGDNYEVIDRLERSSYWKLITFLKAAILLMAAGFFYLFLIAMARRIKGGMPVWASMVLVMIPFIGAGYTVMFKMVDKRLETYYENVSAIQLSRVNRDFMFQMDQKKFEEYWSQPVHTDEKRKDLEINHSQYEYFLNETDGSYTSRQRAKVNQYFYRDGQLYSAESGYFMNLPLVYQMPYEVIVAMEKAVRENKDIYLSYNDGLEGWNSVFTPIVSERGTVIGVLEATIENQWTVLEEIISGKRLKRQITLASLGLLAVVLAVMWLNMRPLSRLKTAVLDLTDGQLDARANVKGSSEVAGIAAMFNRIAENAEKQVQHIESFQKKYEAFLPGEIFGLFGKNGIQNIQPGDEKEIQGTVMALGNVEDRKQNPGDTEYGSGYVFAKINKRLECQIPVIKACGGIVCRFTKSGLETIFPQGDRRQALLAAVSAVQNTRKFQTGAKSYAGITAGQMKLGIMGSEKRCIVSVMASQKNLAWFLQQLAEECNCTILITSQAAREISDFYTGYHFRILGYIYIKSLKRTELIYEVLDGEEEECRRRKTSTKEYFEAGVKAFMAQDIAMARRYFIKVIEYHKEDKAARKYIRLCEEYLEKGQAQEELCLKAY
ncbi:MAG: HAMP domain-containing protein [Lachnoclostridium edouardi]|uniref:HAMP domain-containing protein n=1 Tax=Lachnoclostridium edouardi TaxID=1926283 RepID=UPI0026DAA007|nr:HAMP domain-containing protein [Lachnoclostridium edouardi]MDO4278951.1 HAMP domain-containing protein [Lachnoclostridium edouardi]